MNSDIAPLPGYPESVGLLCAALQDATSEWRGELWGEEIGPEAMTWRVRPGGQSMGAIFQHMMLVELFWLEEFALGTEIDPSLKAQVQWDEIDVDEGIWPNPPAQPLAWYFERQDAIRRRTLDAIKQWPAADTFKPHHGREISLRWVLSHVVQHEAYHGGQIVLLNDLRKRTL